MSNWLQKLGFGLQKSSNKITYGIADIFSKQKIDSQTLEELEELLLNADIGIHATNRIIQNFAKKRFDKTAEIQDVKKTLASDIAEILKPCEQKFTISKQNKYPFVVLMVGVNGAGKTTTIGKIASKFQKQYKVSFIAGDTFRAAATEQIEEWGKRCNIRVHKGNTGCDAAGLCFDGLLEAIKQQDDIVFIDTAGRLQNKVGLMDELKKITKVISKVIPNAPHATLLTLDSTTGQNALEQIKTFGEIINLTGLVITKLDGSSKGGIVVAMAQETTIPIHYIGIGEQIDDLNEFKADEFANSLLELNS